MYTFCIKALFVNFCYYLINLPLGKTERFSLDSNERVAGTKRPSLIAIWCGIMGESSFDNIVHLYRSLLLFSKIPHQPES